MSAAGATPRQRRERGRPSPASPRARPDIRCGALRIDLAGAKTIHDLHKRINAGQGFSGLGHDRAEIPRPNRRFCEQHLHILLLCGDRRGDHAQSQGARGK
jgi:hypothetical protein